MKRNVINESVQSPGKLGTLGALGTAGTAYHEDKIFSILTSYIKAHNTCFDENEE